MKKIIALLVICLFSFSLLVGCGSNNDVSEKDVSEKETEKVAQNEEYPTKPINVIVSYSAGGGTDVGARILLPYVEKELGVPLNVINKPGGGGWIGWTELLNSNPDGYTIGYINTPNLMTGYLNPEYERQDKSIDSFAIIANHVLDYGAIAVNIDEDRFSTIEELMEYAKNNELTAASTGVGSDDHIAMLKLNKNFGTKFVNVATKGAADGKAGLLGKHIDIWMANVGEVTVPHNNGELKVLGILAPERSEFLPDIPTLEEAGFPGVYSWSARGLAAPKGIDSEILDKLVAAFEKGINNPEQKAKMAEMGLAVKFLKGQDYYDFLKSDEEGVISVGDLLGWD